MEQIQTQTRSITKDMPIAEILDSFPDKSMLISEILIDFGIHCVGCGASSFETLEEGVLGHGFTEEELNMLVHDLNKVINTKTEKATIENFTITLTEKAAQKLKQIMSEEKKENSFLRATVLAGGCSGYSYDLELTDEKYPTDFIIEQNKVIVLVDQNSAEYLNGTKIDFVDTLNESGFKFHNPNATKECGCGKSFS